jgi:hypothetical protein
VNIFPPGYTPSDSAPDDGIIGDYSGSYNYGNGSLKCLNGIANSRYNIFSTPSSSSSSYHSSSFTTIRAVSSSSSSCSLLPAPRPTAPFAAGVGQMPTALLAVTRAQRGGRTAGRYMGKHCRCRLDTHLPAHLSTYLPAHFPTYLSTHLSTRLVCFAAGAGSCRFRRIDRHTRRHLQRLQRQQLWQQPGVLAKLAFSDDGLTGK